MTHGSKEDAAALQAVRRAIDGWRNAVNAGDIDRILQITADDFEIMPPGQSALSGGSAREFLKGFVGQFAADLQPFTNEEIIVSGDWAIQRLTYHLTLTPKSGGDPITERGDGLHILRREPGGSWRLVKDISTSVSEASGAA
jgi:ketosteroid isomerase-like protein